MERHRDRAFTLVEVLVAVTLLGLVMTVLAGTIVVVLRVGPTNEFRVDAARSNRGLQTWLSHDVGSTPPFTPVDSTYGGYDFAPAADPCSVSVVGSVSIITLVWRERLGATTNTWTVNYRLETAPHDFQVARYRCGASGTERLRLTTSVRNDQPCGAASATNSGYARGDLDAGRVVNLHVCLTAVDGGESVPIVVDVASRNPSEAFP